MTNQAIIEQNSNPFSNGIKSASVWVKGFFSESTVKALEEKTKTDTQIFIEDLAKHAQLWSEKTNTSKDTVFSSSSCVTPKNGSCQ